jgi:hypothetical protein
LFSAASLQEGSKNAGVVQRLAKVNKKEETIKKYTQKAFSRFEEIMTKGVRSQIQAYKVCLASAMQRQSLICPHDFFQLLLCAAE